MTPYRDIPPDEFEEQEINMKKLWEYLPEFVAQLEKQFKDDDKRWGNTWLERTREGQEQRIRTDFDNYFDQFEQAGTPVPWMKIIGNAFIGWMRAEGHPELWEK